MAEDAELRRQCAHAHHTVLKHIEIMGVTAICAVMGMVIGVIGIVGRNTGLLMVALLPLLAGLVLSFYGRSQLKKDRGEFDLLQSGQCPNVPDEQPRPAKT